MEGRARRIAVILPFEARLYERHGARAVFVGHPLLDEEARPDPRQLALRLGVEPERPVLALFPGSRVQELQRHAGPFTAAARELRRRVPTLEVIVSRVSFLPQSAYASFPFPTTGDAASLRALATAGLVKSGTGTLEAALAGMPFAVAYVTHPVTFLLARRLVRVSHVALPNLVVGRRVVPEFMQGEATAGAMADALEPLLDEGSAARRETTSGLREVRAALGSPGAASRVAGLVEEVLREAGSGGRR